MKYNQGDVVTLKSAFKLPDGELKKHPILIISSSDSNSYEDHYTGVMMSSTKRTDRYSFKCEDFMFIRPLEKKGCHLRLYIIVGFNGDDIYSLFNQMSTPFVKQVINQVKEMVFAIS